MRHGPSISTMSAKVSVPCRGTTSSGRQCKRTVSPDNPLYERGLCGRCSGSIWGTPENDEDVDSSAEHPLGNASLMDPGSGSEWRDFAKRLNSPDLYSKTASVLHPFGRPTITNSGESDLDNAVWVGPINEFAPITMLATDGRCVAFSFTAPAGLGDDDAHCLRLDDLAAMHRQTSPGRLASPVRKRIVDQDEWRGMEQMLEATEEYFFVNQSTGGLAGSISGSIVTLSDAGALNDLLASAHSQIADAWTPDTGITEDQFVSESRVALLVEPHIDHESGEPMGVGVACCTFPRGATAPNSRLVLGGVDGYLQTVCADLDIANRLQHPETHAVSVNIRHLERLRDAASALNARGIELGLPRPTGSDIEFMDPGTTLAPTYCTLTDDVSVVMESVFEESF